MQTNCEWGFGLVFSAVELHVLHKYNYSDWPLNVI
uniref:Uncharacterized protein n=1 Tax=Anguilla anguilla TaxID=7936 RepID=A0A0E9X854_ANGAN